MYKWTCSFFILFLLKLLWEDLQAVSSPQLTRSEDKRSPREDKRMFKFYYYFLFFHKCSFWTYIYKKTTHSQFGAWSFFLVHLWFTPSEGPKGFVDWFFKEIRQEKLEHEVGPWKKAIFHGPTSWSMMYTGLWAQSYGSYLRLWQPSLLWRNYALNEM